MIENSWSERHCFEYYNEYEAEITDIMIRDDEKVEENNMIFSNLEGL